MANYLLDTGLVIRHLRGQRRVVQFVGLPSLSLAPLPEGLEA
jgi:hypothetical protein